MSVCVLEALHIHKRFGDMAALDDVSLRLEKNHFHALLGENGAGKSTLVKCIMGYYQPDAGQLMFNNKEEPVPSPQVAASLGVGMVYQHFTLIPNMTIAENIVLSRAHLPRVISWRDEIAQLEDKMRDMPFQFDVRRYVRDLSVGEKQKVEITKQLLLDSRILILDEPTSVLTPAEADEVLDKVHALTRAGRLSVLMISHKFREVMRYADAVTVLRKGRFVASSATAATTEKQLADWMLGGESLKAQPPRAAVSVTPGVLQTENLSVKDDLGCLVVRQLPLSVGAGEIFGIAGVSGNGQNYLVEALAGQRNCDSGRILLHGRPYTPGQAAAFEAGFFCLPEEPLRNACVRNLSLAENLCLRRFNRPPFARWGFWLNRRAMADWAREKIAEYQVRTQGPQQPIGGLSGGNVQRVVLARELAEGVKILVVANPCFGLDFKAVADIRSRILAARNQGVAVLLISEDLDEVLALSDRFAVMSGGKLYGETTPAQADMTRIGELMAGQGAASH
jgi:general nucleoside transport system ATP-binding protein